MLNFSLQPLHHSSKWHLPSHPISKWHRTCFSLKPLHRPPKLHHMLVSLQPLHSFHHIPFSLQPVHPISQYDWNTAAWHRSPLCNWCDDKTKWPRSCPTRTNHGHLLFRTLIHRTQTHLNSAMPQQMLNLIELLQCCHRLVSNHQSTFGMLTRQCPLGGTMFANKNHNIVNVKVLIAEHRAHMH